MGEKIHEKLFKLASVLHWFGRFEEMQAVSALAGWLRDESIETWDDAIKAWGL